MLRLVETDLTVNVRILLRLVEICLLNRGARVLHGKLQLRHNKSQLISTEAGTAMASFQPTSTFTNSIQ